MRNKGYMYMHSYNNGLQKKERKKNPENFVEYTSGQHIDMRMMEYVEGKLKKTRDMD